jgi:ankyrin repeat protein
VDYEAQAEGFTDTLNQAKRWIEEGSASGLQSVLEASPDLHRAQDESGRTLVNFACRVLTGDVSRPPVRGTPEQEAAFDVLLKAGCDIASAGHEGFAPLHVVAMASHAGLAQKLLGAGGPRSGRSLCTWQLNMVHSTPFESLSNAVLT